MEFDARIPYEKLQGKHVVLGLSGGVDSSVSAALLKENGMHVTALFMKNWEEDDTNSFCAAAKDREDAQKVCDKLGIELKTINFAAEYWDNVFEIFLSEYKEGRTPNPDILCNKEIKFKAFMQYAMEVLNADYIRTARAKGLSERKVIYTHAFRNTMIPLVTLLAGILPSLFGGMMITEQVFGIDGIGRLAYNALKDGDIPFVMGYNMFLAVLTVIGTLFSDIMYSVVDPRVKLGK